jgi:hypothetical protein
MIRNYWGETEIHLLALGIWMSNFRFFFFYLTTVMYHSWPTTWRESCMWLHWNIIAVRDGESISQSMLNKRNKYKQPLRVKQISKHSCYLIYCHYLWVWLYTGYGLVDWFIDRSELQVNTGLWLISTLYKSPQHPLSLFQPVVSSQAVPW